jgi:hypothetical protein
LGSRLNGSCMPRRLRLETAGALYHVLNRGNYRRDVFAAAGAASAFERTLGGRPNGVRPLRVAAWAGGAGRVLREVT